MDIQLAKYKELIEQQLEELAVEDVLGQSAQKTVELDQQSVGWRGLWGSLGADTVICCVAYGGLLSGLSDGSFLMRQCLLSGNFCRRSFIEAGFIRAYHSIGNLAAITKFSERNAPHDFLCHSWCG